MGGEVSSLSYRGMPDAILTFGTLSDSTTLDKLRPIVSDLKNVISLINAALSKGGKYIDFLSPAVLGVPGYALTLFTTLEKLIAETDKLHKELAKLEENIYSTILDGKINALKNQLEILKDKKTHKKQKIAELAVAVSNFHEIISIFKQQSSILYKKYFIGAQLFLPIYGIFISIITIAVHTPEYNNPLLGSLKTQYRETLESFRNRCIRSRLQLIHTVSSNGFGGFENKHYEKGLKEEFPQYFESGNVKEEFTVNCGRSLSWHEWPAAGYVESILPMLFDPWDPRKFEQITFSTVVLHKTEGYRFIYDELWRKAVFSYRTNVKNVMEEFFNAVGP